MTDSRKKTSHTGRNKSKGRRPSAIKAALRLIGFVLLGGTTILALAVGVYALKVDSELRAQFDGKRWAIPARVYARPLELFSGLAMSADQFLSELELLRYRAADDPRLPGTYARNGASFEVITRSFAFWDGAEASRHIRVGFEGDSLETLDALDSQGDPGLWRMEPAEIAGIYPSHKEDRILVKREEIPSVLVDALIAVEDRSFYEHWGVDVKGIMRALIANLKAGRTVQGGSTLTQQLVKNFFLTNVRTVKRKLNEMLRAVLIELHYSKDEILEAYANEVYLGQDGDRAIHGLGLASRFYFGRRLDELNLHHVALLVGLIRGPSYYDPRRHPERAEARRELVLNVMVDQNLVSAEDAAIAKAMPLDVLAEPPSGISRYPAFIELVQRQLREHYREEDLTTEGLKIFTTLNPQVQKAAEQAIITKLPDLEKAKAKAEELDAAAVLANPQTGEVLAVVGGREVRLAGFNRALDAQRPIGSLVKPAVYLTALEYPGRYTLATLLNDRTPLVYSDGRGKKWSPSNYDKRYHGEVLLQEALAHSYNVPTARLGLDLGVMEVVKTLQRLGIEKDPQPYPSLLLGSLDLSPFEVTQMYETFASGGFRIPLRAIREVTTAEGEPLQRYPLRVEKAIEPGPAYLITKAMQRVVESGTASAMKQLIPSELGIAGKTGTTDDYRDSWFAGFSGNVVAVVWIGRDDNQPTGLSGSSGALRVWMEIMKNLHLEPVALAPPSQIEYVPIDPRSGLLADGNCRGRRSIPFLAGSAPYYPAPCSAAYYSGRQDYLQDDGYTSGPSRPASSEDAIDEFFRRLME